MFLGACENVTDCRMVARAYAAETLEQNFPEDVPEHEQRILDALITQGSQVRAGAEYATAYRLCMKEYR